jgi:hypothetical protein
MLGHFEMIPLINHDFSFGRTGFGRDEIYPDYRIVNPTKPKTTTLWLFNSLPWYRWPIYR